MIRIGARVNIGGALRRIEQERTQIEQAMRRGLIGGARIVEAEAKHLISTGERSGVVYVRGNVEHQASAPGEPPATDTGNLLNSIQSDISDASRLEVYVEAQAEYAGALEFGTFKMAPRPFLRPALSNVRRDVADEVRAAVAQVSR